MVECIIGYIELIGLIVILICYSMLFIMYNEVFVYFGLDYVYFVFEVGNQELKDVVQGFWVMKLCGFNVFMLNKIEICQYFDKLLLVVQLVGVVNIVVNDDGVLIGYIIDGIGYMCVFSEVGIDIIGKKMIVFGVGGVVMVFCVQVVLDGVKVIFIFNCCDKFFVNVEEIVVKICYNIDCEIYLFDFDDYDKLCVEIDSSVILINVIGVGMKLFEGQMLLFDDSFLCLDLIVFDVVYNLCKIYLLEVVEKKGCCMLNGLGMMLW